MNKKALLVGATGLIGKELLEMLLEDNAYQEVRVLSRRELPQTSDKLTLNIIDFEHLEQVEESFFAVDDVFCTLGITLKKAGSKEKAYQVEYEYPFRVAQKSQKAGCQQFLIVTSIGANPESKNYYFRTKGLLEKALQELALPALHILRPSLLLGPRREIRLGEDLAKVLNHAFAMFIPYRYKGIKARTVAKFMQAIAQKKFRGKFIYESEVIRQIEVKSFDMQQLEERTTYREL